MTISHKRTLLVLAAFALLSATSLAQGPIEVEAIAGQPFGVGRISVRFPKEALPVVLGAKGISVWEQNNRILYPVVQTPPDNTIVKNLLLNSPLLEGGPVRREVAGILQGFMNQTPKTTVYFLFSGDEPLDVTLQTRDARRLQIVPRGASATAAQAIPPAPINPRDLRGRRSPRVPRNPASAFDRMHERLLAEWWKELNAKPGGLLQSKPDYPPLVKNYIQSMLAVQLGLPLPDAGKNEDWWTQIEQHLGLFLGTESVLLAAERGRMLGLEATHTTADLPLPEPIDWPPLEIPDSAKDVKIESIAKRVPAECLYVRFGNYANFLWIQDTIKKWGGDMSNLVALRGLDRDSSARMERQLVLKQTALGRMLGGTVISDVAIIGTDVFMNEGAAYGILFEARNEFMLNTNFTSHHSEILKQDKSVAKQTVEIAGKKVTYLSNPTGSVRSYYLADKGYILTTTSKSLMRRFIETGTTKTDDKGTQTPPCPALADAPGFRHAREVMPLEREDTIFVYLGDEFFRNMAGPRYWIGMARRLQAAADIQLTQLAALAATGRRMPAGTIDELIRGRFLPGGFQNRAAGNKTVLDGNNVYDSLYGHPGSLVPIPDVPLAQVTAQEAAAYERFVNFYLQKWGRLDPMMAGIRRHELPDNQERVVIDVEANPFARQHYDMLAQRLGAADKTQIAPIPGDIMFLEAQLTDQRIFGGVQDVSMPFSIADGQFMPRGGLFNSIVGYLGTTGNMGLLSILNQLISTPANAGGYSGSENGLWRHQGERFTVFSFQQDVLAMVCAQLHFEEAQRPAQIRMHVKDVARARITPTLNALGYLRTRDTSLGNIRLMQQLAQQFHVPGPDCQATADRLLNAKLICPLGGKYEYVKTPDGLGYWTSTAFTTGQLAQGRNQLMGISVPQGYLSPPLNWFRGLDMDATLTPKALSAHVEIVMQLPEEKPTEQAPNNAKTSDNTTNTQPQPPKKTGGWLESLLPPKK